MFIPADKIANAFGLLKQDALQPGARVLVFVATDCDSLCAARIFVALLKRCYISYSLKPVTSCEDLLLTLQQHLLYQYEQQQQGRGGNISSCVLINCGNIIDIPGFLQQEQSLMHQTPTFYICDTHLPAHPSNIEDQDQVHLYPRTSDYTRIPTRTPVAR